MKLIKLVLVGVMLVLPLTATSPVKADSAFNLVVNGGVITPWNIGNLAPGASFTENVELHNAGDTDGYLSVWIDSVVNLEGENPEAETGDTAEPGELGQYMMLNLLGEDIDPYTSSYDFHLPVALNEFPQSSSSPLMLHDQSLRAGETIQIQWECAILPQTTNVIQGDRVTFTIHYLLTSALLFPRPLPPESTISIFGYYRGDTWDDDSEKTEDITDSDVETEEPQVTDTGIEESGDNITVIYSGEAGTGDDIVEAVPLPADEGIKPVPPDTEDTQSKPGPIDVSSPEDTPAREILSWIGLIVAVIGIAMMIILAYLAHQRG
jgi:hypothetical protein